jgi:hypothetical protein
MIVLYHRTTTQRAEPILRDGFREHGPYLIGGRLWSGIWLSDRPLDENEGARGDALLQISLNCTEADIADYEWVQDISFGYREWLIPAAFINAHASASLVDEDAIEEGTPSSLPPGSS